MTTVGRGRRVAAEGVGTFVLVFYAVGSAVFGIKEIFPVGVALAFGFLLLALAYGIGPISGAHVNPAVTLGVLAGRGISGAEAGAYMLAQVLGAIAAGGLLKVMTTVGGVTDNTGAHPSPGHAGLAIGLVLTVIHLVGIPLTGTGVNPARSIGPALFYWPALPQLWLFIVAPLVGAALAAGVARLLVPVHRERVERTRDDRPGEAVL
jgi:aquaporin Z